MKPTLLCRLSTVAVFILSLCHLAVGQSQPAQVDTQPQPSAEEEILRPGVVIEKVWPDSSDERAGLREEDILLSWSRGSLAGNINSQFEFFEMAVEQESLGHVTVTGIRNGMPHAWTLGMGVSLPEMRPNFTGWALRSYQQSERLRTTSPTRSAQLLLRLADKFAAQHPTTAAWIILHAAQILDSTNDWRKADSLCAQLVRDGKKYGALVVTSAHLRRAYLSWKHGDLATARQYELQAFEESKTFAPNSLVTVFFLNVLLQLAWTQNDLVEAERLGLEAVSTAIRVAPGSFAVAGAEANLAPVMLARGNVAEAEENYVNALGIADGKDGLVTSQLLSGLATISWRRGDLDSAEAKYRRALKLLEDFTPGYLVAANFQGLGTVSRDRGELGEAMQLEQRALEIFRKINNKSGIASSFNDLGFLALYRGNPAAAQHYFHEALIIERAILPGTLRLANTLMGMGMSLSAAENSVAARPFLLNALNIQSKTVPPVIDAARTLSALGYVEEIHEDLSRAAEYYRAALAIEEQVAPDSMFMAQTLSRMGRTAHRRGSFSEAEQFYRRGLAIAERLARGSWQHAEILGGLAHLHWREKRLELATQYYEEALAAMESQSQRLGGPDLDQANFRATHGDIYRQYVQLLISAGQPEKAFKVLEGSRARSLLETLMAARIDVQNGADPALLNRERSLQAEIRAKSERRVHLLGEKHGDEQIQALENKISELAAEYQELESHIRSTNPNYSALTQPQPLTARQIQEQVFDQDTLLLEYSLGEERSHVFAVTRDSLQVFELANRAEIEREARRVYGLLTARNREISGETAAQRELRWKKNDAEYELSSRALSRMVLGPVGELIKNKRLVIVADGALHYIPFAALPEPEADGKSPVPLTVNHEIVSLPSASVLALLRQQYKDRKPAPQAVAVLADPVFDKDDPRVNERTQVGARPNPTRGTTGKSVAEDLFSTSLSSGLLTRSADDLGLRRNGQLALTRLRYTRLEADAIRAAAPAGQVLEAVDFKANRATATSPELANYRIVHFATHGLLNSKHPELSGLVLSLVDQKGQPQDGFLTLQDIYNMNLSADLVVLSACETGLGKEISGEGLIGLTRGFMYAGATRVVASLWKVSDVATAELMAEFYKGIEKEGLTPAAALRAAQVKMWKQKRWNSPYYWVAFQIQGEWK